MLFDLVIPAIIAVSKSYGLSKFLLGIRALISSIYLQYDLTQGYKVVDNIEISLLFPFYNFFFSFIACMYTVIIYYDAYRQISMSFCYIDYEHFRSSSKSPAIPYFLKLIVQFEIVFFVRPRILHTSILVFPWFNNSIACAISLTFMVISSYSFNSMLFRTCFY